MLDYFRLYEISWYSQKRIGTTTFVWALGVRYVPILKTDHDSNHKKMRELQDKVRRLTAENQNQKLELELERTQSEEGARPMMATPSPLISKKRKNLPRRESQERGKWASTNLSVASHIEVGLLSSNTDTHSDMDVDKTIVESIVTTMKMSLSVGSGKGGSRLGSAQKLLDLTLATIAYGLCVEHGKAVSKNIHERFDVTKNLATKANNVAKEFFTNDRSFLGYCRCAWQRN